MNKSIFIILLCISAQGFAGGLNQRKNLSPSVRVKVNTFLAKAYAPSTVKTAHEEQSLINNNRGNKDKKQDGAVQTINSFSNVLHAPKEVTTAVRGDIVNICFHCR